MSGRGGGHRASRPWRWLAGAWLAVAAWSAAAAESYLVVSTIGRELSVVFAAKQVGGRVEPPRQGVAPLEASGLDDYAARTAYAVIRKSRPDAAVDAFRVTDASLGTGQGAWLGDGTAALAELLASLRKELPPGAAGTLLLIVPLRADIQLRLQQVSGEEGQAAGLGFFIDADAALRRGDTGAGALSYLGLYANFQVLLVDLATGKVLAHERVANGTTVSASRATDRSPWSAIPDERKVAILQGLAREGIERSVSAMLGPGRK